MKQDNENFDDFLFASLENYEVKPSDNLKKRINKNLFFVNLFRYNFGKLIISVFLIAVILSLIIGTLCNNMPEPAKPFYVKGQNKKEQIQSYKKIRRPVSTLSNTSVTTSINNNRTTPVNKIKTKNHSTEDLINVTSPENNNIEEKTIVSNNSKEYLPVKPIKNNNSVNIENISINKNVIDREKLTGCEENTTQYLVFSDTSQLSLPDSKNSADTTNITKASARTENYLASTNKITEPKFINSENNIHGLLATNEGDTPALTSNTINPDNQIQKTDSSQLLIVLKNDSTSITNDTIFNFKGEQVFIKSKVLSIEAYGTELFHQSSYSAAGGESKVFAMQRNNALTPLPGFAYGVNFNITSKHFLIQAGIGCTKISDEFSYASLLLNPRQQQFISQNNNPFNYTHNGNYFLIDTIGGYWHYTYMQDSLIHIKDSVWVNQIDTHLVHVFDTTQKTVFDTLKNKRMKNSYLYFEIPVMAGYEVSYKKFDFAVKGGIITSVLIAANGENTTNGNELLPINAYLPFKKIYFSWIVSLSANYRFSEYWGIYAEPYYRQGIGSMLIKNTILNQTIRAFGIKCGIKYSF